MSFEDEVKDELAKGLPKDPVLECVKILAGSDENYKRFRTGEGFNKRDLNIGKALAELTSLKVNQFDRAKQLIKKYEDQLPPKLYVEAVDADYFTYYGPKKEETEEIEEKAEVDGITFSIPMTTNKVGQKVLDFHALAKELMDKFKFKLLKDRKAKSVALVCYDQENGVYTKNGEDRLSYIVEHSLKNRAPINIKNEILRRVKDYGYELIDNWLSSSNPHIVVENGIINLEKFVNGDTNCLEPFSPDFHSFNKLNVIYDPGAPSELLINHLNTVIPDQSDRDRFQKFIGSFLETNGYGHQKIIVLYGHPGSGKTITLRTFIKFFGIENVTSKSFQQLVEDRFASADLFGMMANIVEELPQDAIKYLERLNSLTGGLVNGQKKGRDPFDFFQNAKICAACNDLPIVFAATETIRAFMSRLIIIVFEHVFRGTDEEIQNYDDVLLAQKSGILNWVLQGYKKYVQDGKKILSSKSTDETLEYYIANSDFLAYFAEGCFEKGDPEDFVIKETVWQAYIRAAKIKEVPAQSRQTVLQNFPTKLKFTIGSERISIGKKENGSDDQQHVFTGIRMRQPEFWFKKRDEIDDQKMKDGELFVERGYRFKVGNSGNLGSKNDENGQHTLEGTDKKVGNLGNQLPDLPNLPTLDPHPPLRRSDGNFTTSSGDLSKKIIGYLKEHPDPSERKISIIYDLILKEWYPQINGEEAQALIDEIRKGSTEIIFDYPNQLVTLNVEMSTHE